MQTIFSWLLFSFTKLLSEVSWVDTEDGEESDLIGVAQQLWGSVSFQNYISTRLSKCTDSHTNSHILPSNIDFETGRNFNIPSHKVFHLH